MTDNFPVDQKACQPDIRNRRLSRRHVPDGGVVGEGHPARDFFTTIYE